MAMATAIRLAPVVDDLLADTLAPLHHMVQQGFAPLLFARHIGTSPIPFSQTPNGYTRANHSKYVAALNTVFAAQMQLPEAGTNALVLAGLVHDVGHVALGHKMEWAVRDIDPKFCHERNGLRRLLMDRDFETVLHGLKLSIADVFTIMYEQGPLGALQSLSDTVSYCFVDLLAYGFLGHRDEDLLLPTIYRLINSLQLVEQGSALHTASAVEIQSVLSWRAMLYRDNFCAPESWRCHSALRSILQSLNAARLLQDFHPARFESDEAVLSHLRELTHSTGRGSLIAMLNLANETSRSPTEWHVHGFPTEEAVLAWLRDHDDIEEVLGRSFMYAREPTSCLMKTIPVHSRGRTVAIGPREDVLLPIQGPAYALYEWIGP